MTNEFVPVERHRQGGKVFSDADGCFYLRPHSHPLLKGKTFANTGEMLVLITDHNNSLDVRSGNVKPFTGEVILLNVLTF